MGNKITESVRTLPEVQAVHRKVLMLKLRYEDAKELEDLIAIAIAQALQEKEEVITKLEIALDGRNLGEQNASKKIAALEDECQRLREQAEDDERSYNEAHNEVISLQSKLAQTEKDAGTFLESRNYYQELELRCSVALRTAEAQVERLKKYVEHNPGCATSPCDPYLGNKNPCTCGLDAALKGTP